MTYTLLDRKEAGVRVITPLVYLDDDSNRWGWWCPVCTDEDETDPGFVVGTENYRNKDNARKAAVKHEDEVHCAGE